MARDGSGNYSLPANTLAVSGDPISSTKFNTLVQDLESDANTDRPIAAGGTGASTAANARINLGLVIGTDVQAFDAGLLSIAGLTTQADRSIYTTASDTYAVYTLTAAGRAILDDADAPAQRTTLGLGTAAVKNTGTSGDAVPLLNGNNTFSGNTEISGSLLISAGFGGAEGGEITLKSPATTSISGNVIIDVNGNSVRIFESTGANRGVTIDLTAQGSPSAVWTSGNDGAGSGLDADLIDGVQPSAFALTILDDADASAARTTLGLANGATTTISPFALTMLDDVDAAAVRTTIGVGLGTGDLVAANNLSDVANASTARTNLGLAIGTNVQAFDQQLQDIAALAVTDGGFIVGNGSTFVLETDATARTSLGLGTAATVNTGTSGATIPLLNAVNTFSAAQTVGARLQINNGTGDALSLFQNSSGAELIFKHTDSGLSAFRAAEFLWSADGSAAVKIGEIDASGVHLTSGKSYRVNGNTVWHAGNDGAGSGLDADTLDGIQPSAFALTLLDDADASAARTTLGLGTAAVVNTGTSGATIPLLNGANTFSADQFVSNGTGTVRAATNGDLYAGRGNGQGYVFLGDTPFPNYVGWDGSKYVAGANTLWHAGNDGAGSGLDADTLDGVQGSAFATLANSQTFTGDMTISKATPVFDLIATSSNIPAIQLRNASRYDDIRNTTAGLEFRVDTSGTPKSMLFTSAGGLQVRIAASTETTGTLTSASANKTIQATGDITIDNSVFAAGDIIVIYAGASARTLTQGSGVTMRLGGTATTGSRTLAARGVAMLFFVSASEVVVSGGAVT